MTWILERRVDKPPMTFNGALRGQSTGMMRGLARTVRDWRKWAKQEAEDRLWEPFAEADYPVTVDVIHLRKNGQGVADPLAAALLGKAMVDGLRDTDPPIMPNDTGRYVRGYWVPSPVIVGYHGVRVIIREHVAAGAEHHRSITTHTPAGGLTLTGIPLVPLKEGNGR